MSTFCSLVKKYSYSPSLSFAFPLAFTTDRWVDNQEVAAYFGFYMFLESPENEDNYDTYWDGYCDYVSDPDRLAEQIKGKSF